MEFSKADSTVQGGHTFRMLAAFENWFTKSGEFGARQLAILRILGLFDRPADPGCLGALRKPPAIAGLTDPLFTTGSGASTGQPTAQPLVEEGWNAAISFLCDFGLLTIQADTDNKVLLVDSHPLPTDPRRDGQLGKRWCTRNDRSWPSATCLVALSS